MWVWLLTDRSTNEMLLVLPFQDRETALAFDERSVEYLVQDKVLSHVVEETQLQMITLQDAPEAS